MATAGLPLGELAAAVADRSRGRLSARITGRAEQEIAGVAPLDLGGPGQLAFLSNARYRAQAAASVATAIVLSPDDAAALFPQGRGQGALVTCPAPYAWFALAAQVLAPAQPQWPAGVHPTACVDPTAQIDPLAAIGPQAVIAAQALIGAGAQVGAGSFIGEAARVGAATVLAPRVSLMHGCSIGARGIVHSGAVIGADGFGFAPFEGRYLKIPQTGVVRVGDDVEIGANTTIDRGTMGDTVIEDGVKLDNLVQVAHNVHIGAHTVVAGCAGIAGSARIGRGCQIGGAAMIAGHLEIADGCIISAGTLISRSIKAAGFYSGVFPFMPNRDWERNAALVRHLDELRARLRSLEAAARSTSQGKPSA
ncbi:MAG: UDP-3-O-(3-hydroxymyristoyl)glucosamine N-acyltransferase [Betaproteobacteria bacterium]